MPDHPHGPARRGRRNPELAAELALDPEALAQDADEPQPEEVFLYDGDIVTCKITREVEIVPKYSTFVSYGVTTRVQPGEPEENVFIRVANTVHERVNQLVEAEEQAYEAELAERRNRPIEFKG